MSSSLFKNIYYLILACLFQILIFNQLIFFGMYFPIIYILWIYYAPIKKDKYTTLIFSFILGFIIDLFLSTGGIHAFASVLITFFKKSLVKTVSSSRFEIPDYKNFSIIKKIIFLFLFILLHHLALFLLDDFKLSNILNLFQKLINNTIISFIFIFLIIKLLERKTQNK